MYEDFILFKTEEQKILLMILIERGVNSLYGSAEVSWKRILYLNGTLRNDWFSTLSPENRSILYPSVSGLCVFRNLHTNPGYLLEKLRLGYAEVGSDGDVPALCRSIILSDQCQFVG